MGKLHPMVPGRKSALAAKGFASGYIGADFEIASDYCYVKDQSLPHRWRGRRFDRVVTRDGTGEPLKNSARSIGTASHSTPHPEGFERLRTCGVITQQIVCTDPEIGNPLTFAMEKHLEDVLVANWSQPARGREFTICEEEGELRGQQYMTDTGPLDILAVGKDRKRLLIVELKCGRASDVAVGEIPRCMGCVCKEIATGGQSVEGVTIALEDDQRLRRALSVVPAVRFFRYEVSFRLVEG